MPQQKTLPSHLKLVTKTNTVESSNVGLLAGTQSEMFPLAKPHLLIFSDLTKISSESFLSLISDAKPTLILDLRPIPRFDFGRLNRKAIFKLFQTNDAIYIDVTGAIGVSSKADANLNPSLMAKSLSDMTKTMGFPMRGPLLFLFDDSNLLSASTQVFADTLSHKEGKKWEVCIRT